MSKARILIVEDEVIIALQLEQKLKSLGYEVTSIVNNADDAIKIAEVDKPDLILMDIRIQGDTDGIDTAEIIRERFGTPVIFSTAYLDQERIERAKITMPFGYVLKPIQERDLKVTLEMALYVAKADAERRKAEVAIIKEKETAQKYLDIAGVIFVALNTEGIVTLINKKGCEILGYNSEDIVGKNWFHNFIPEWLREDLIPVSKQLLSGDIDPVEYYENPVFTKSGEERIIAWHNTIIKDEDGSITGHLSSGEDVTERQKKEKEIIELKEFYQEISEKAEDGIWVTDADEKMIYFNPGMENISGVKSSDALGLSITNDFPEETIKHFITFYIKAKETLLPQQYEASVVTPKGRSTVQSGWLVPRIKDSKYNGMICTIQDITERKQVEEKILFHSQILDCIDQAVIATNLNGQVLYLNKAAEKLYKWPAEEALKMNIMDVNVSQISQQQGEEIMAKLSKGEKWEGEFMVQCKEGSTFLVHVTDSPIHDDGNLVGIVGISRKVEK